MSDESKKAEWNSNLESNLAGIEKQIEGSPSAPWFTGGRMSYIDIGIYYALWMWRQASEQAVAAALDKLPKVRHAQCMQTSRVGLTVHSHSPLFAIVVRCAQIKAIYEAVEKDERIAKHVAERKPTPF